MACATIWAIAQKRLDIIAADIIAADIIAADIIAADIIAADICRGFEAEGRFVTAEVDVRDFDALRAAVDSGAEQGRLDVIVAWMPAAV